MKKTAKRIKLGLCEGRHDLPPVDGYIFPSTLNPTDVVGLEEEALYQLQRYPQYAKIELYVTGLSVALVAAINAARANDQSLTLWHYDRERGEYYPQPVL